MTRRPPDASTPVNTGTIEVKAGGTLTLDQATDINGTGNLTVDAAASPWRPVI